MNKAEEKADMIEKAVTSIKRKVARLELDRTKQLEKARKDNPTKGARHRAKALIHKEVREKINKAMASTCTKYGIKATHLKKVLG